MRWLAILLVISPLVARAEFNDTTQYRVRQNDTFGIIAAEFYGDRTKSAFIMAENKIIHARPLQQGQRLRVPITREITTSPGDTFQSLAVTFLGDATRGAFLAETNQLPADASLPAGIPILVPFTVTHTAQNTESLASIAANYYGDGKKEDILRRYNSLDKQALEKGDVILVPSFNVRVHPKWIPGPDEAGKQRREDRRKFSKQAASAIPTARHAWRIGDYTRVRSELQGIDTVYIDLDHAVEIHVLLGSALVSFDKTTEALAVFEKLVERKPGHALRKVDHSPKVLAVWTKANGQVE